ncbi:D-aminoacyl-tRNA deacylase [Haloferula sp.]|uniref:D-aminoacyl-tRNA deacylase n=1 Tax=Haloferula sp. TaxID=2497595 RepID=UPI003C785A7C
MRVVIQRVSEASVTIDNQIVSSIGRGLLVLLGIGEEDTPADTTWLVGKVCRLRIFGDNEDKMNLSLAEIEGDVIVVSQFTLHALTRKGNRPSFIRSAKPEISEPLYEDFCKAMESELGKPVGRGRFGADMKVALINDGPVTLVIDSKNRE